MSTDNSEILVNDPAPNVDLLLQEFKQAGVLPNGWYDIAFNQEKRRMIWAGQSPDGKRWDENMPEGEIALPWNGCADTRVPTVDEVCNDDTALLKTAFWKAELRATAVDPDKAPLAASLSAYLHWLVHTKFRRQLRLEVELSSQYRDEHGWAVAYVGWEREIARRRVTVTLEQLAYLSQQPMPRPPQVQTSGPEPEENAEAPTAGGQEEAGEAPGPPGGALNASLPSMIEDPSQEEEAAKMVRSLYRFYVLQELQGKGFYEDELEDERILDLKLSAARRHVRELRQKGKTDLAMPYVCKNQPLVWVLQPYLEFLASRGTMMLQQSRALFWRRWMTEAELESKKAEGWDADWIEEVKKTKGNIASWAGALGATSITGPSTKTVGNTTFLKVTEENNPLIEVLYAFVKKVDDDGVTGVYQTIFSPHVTRRPANLAKKVEKEAAARADGNWKKKDVPTTAPDADFCAKHELLDYAHGQYPFVDLKRENIGRALIDTRSVAEVAGTWQDEEKKQRDMLANRADWDTLPPVSVPKLGGVDYRLGPAANVPLGRTQEIKAINLGAPAPTLSLELIKLLKLQRDGYFGQFNMELAPPLIAVKQENAAGDFYIFWGEVLMHMVALTLQYNKLELVTVTGDPALAQLDPFLVLDQLAVGLEFDVRELNPDFLTQKLDVMNNKVLPGDAAGVIDRAAWTQLQVRMVDPRLGAKLLQDKGSAAQKVYDDTDLQVLRMATGNEAKYVENDPTAQMRLQSLQTILKSNPKYQEWLQKDPRFQELLQRYQENLQMSVKQEQNKVIGRIGVKPMTPAGTAQ